VCRGGILCLIVLTVACSDARHQRSVSSSSTAPTTTTIPVPTFPLTGLPSHGEPPRPALSVKIDNVPDALPQSGLNHADIVWEELVEGGQSRLFATFHSQDADPVGPIRSARPVDADLLDALGGGVFAYSGAAPGEIAPVEDHSHATLLSNDGGVPAFYREPSRPAPHNLYSSTGALYGAGADAGDTSPVPPALFHFGGDARGSAASAVDFVMGERLSAGWRWNAQAGQYERVQNGAPDVVDDGSSVSAANVLLMSVSIEGTGVFDSIGEEDPLVVVIGEGPMWLMRDGRLIEGRWSRATTDVATTYRDTSGADIQFHPGRTWVELVPNTAQPSFG